MTDLDAESLRARRAVPGVVALVVALALLVLPSLLAIADADVLSPERDSGWLGSPVMRFAALQTLAMAVPLALGALAAVRDRGRQYGTVAVVLALLGNFLLLRAVLAVVVTLVLI